MVNIDFKENKQNKKLKIKNLKWLSDYGFSVCLIFSTIWWISYDYFYAHLVNK